MIDELHFRKISEQIMDLSGDYWKGSSTEVLLCDHREGLTRFGNNAVSQHIDTHNHELTIRVQKGARQGKASSNRIDPASLKQTIEKAVQIALIQKEDHALLPLAGHQSYRVINGFVSRTAKVTPAEKVDQIRSAVSLCRKKKTKAAGIFSHEKQGTGLANSNGQFAYHAQTTASFGITVMADDSSGWAEFTHPDISAIHTDDLTVVALDKSLAGRRPKSLSPGPYDVILEPAAVAELLLFMAWEGFGALPYQEGRSFVSGKLGKKVLSDRITITDDAYHAKSIGLNFDYEGMPRRQVVLVDKGVARRVVHDRKTAKVEGLESTGHALPQPNTIGPMPLNLCLQGGNSSLEEMIARTEHGLLITHFHYTNILDPVTLRITGMTRDGVFLVEKGKIRHPVKNLRFTESVVEAFNRIDALGREMKYAHVFWGGGIVAPALKIRGFHFSSATPF